MCSTSLFPYTSPFNPPSGPPPPRVPELDTATLRFPLLFIGWPAGGFGSLDFLLNVFEAWCARVLSQASPPPPIDQWYQYGGDVGDDL